MAWVFFAKLLAGYIFGGCTFWTGSINFKGNFVTFVKFIIRHAIQSLGMEKQILLLGSLAFARNESELPIPDKFLDSSVHILKLLIYNGKLDYIPLFYLTF